MKKLEKDGKIAVLYTPDGVGWSTWNDKYVEEILCMDFDIVQAVLDKDREKTLSLAKKKCKLSHIYMGSFEHLEIVWIVKGRKFRISEYDGAERICFSDDEVYMIA